MLVTVEGTAVWVGDGDGAGCAVALGNGVGSGGLGVDVAIRSTLPLIGVTPGSRISNGNCSPVQPTATTASITETTNPKIFRFGFIYFSKLFGPIKIKNRLGSKTLTSALYCQLSIMELQHANQGF